MVKSKDFWKKVYDEKQRLFKKSIWLKAKTFWKNYIVKSKDFFCSKLYILVRMNYNVVNYI